MVVYQLCLLLSSLRGTDLEGKPVLTLGLFALCEFFSSSARDFNRKIKLIALSRMVISHGHLAWSEVQVRRIMVIFRLGASSGVGNCKRSQAEQSPNNPYRCETFVNLLNFCSNERFFFI